MTRVVAQSSWQSAFPVLDSEGVMVGVVAAEMVGVLAAEAGAQELAVAADLMQPRATVFPNDPVRRAAELLLATELRQLPVVGPDRRVIGFIGESDVMRAHLESLVQALGRTTTGTLPVVIERSPSGSGG
jgi:CBS-domain-containing membrane protein